MKILAAFRWLLAAGCVYFAARHMGSALKIEGYSAALHLLLGFGAFITAIFLISPETVVKVCEFCSWPLTNLVYPGATADKPPLSYRLAHFYSKQLRLAEAVAEYQKIIHYYPRERAAYLELLVLARQMNHEKLYAKYARLFLKRFKDVPFAEQRAPEKLVSGE